MRMIQRGNPARLVEKALQFIRCQLGVQYLDGRLRLEVDMLAQVEPHQSYPVPSERVS